MVSKNITIRRSVLIVMALGIFLMATQEANSQRRRRDRSERTEEGDGGGGGEVFLAQRKRNGKSG